MAIERCAAILRHRPREAGPRISRLSAIANELPYLAEAKGQGVCRGPTGADAFGTIYSSNITPDRTPALAAGRKPPSDARCGPGLIAPGSILYPTFPYDHFTNVTDEDDRALYAFLMTRPAVHAPLAPTSSPPPQPALCRCGWKLLFLRRETYQPDSAQKRGMESRRLSGRRVGTFGALPYAAQCAGAERTSAPFSGGDVDNWHAYAIKRAIPSPLPWTQKRSSAIFVRLASRIMASLGGRWPRSSATCRRCRKRCSRGRSLHDQRVRPANTGSPAPGPRFADANQVASGAVPQTDPAGASIYAAACATCHDTDSHRPTVGQSRSHTAISAPDPRNAANIVLSGIRPVEGERSPIMPGFCQQHDRPTDSSLVNYLRARFSNQPAWTDMRRQSRMRGARRPYISRHHQDRTTLRDPMQRDKP